MSVLPSCSHLLEFRPGLVAASNAGIGQGYPTPIVSRVALEAVLSSLPSHLPEYNPYKSSHYSSTLRLPCDGIFCWSIYAFFGVTSSVRVTSAVHGSSYIVPEQKPVAVPLCTVRAEVLPRNMDAGYRDTAEISEVLGCCCLTDTSCSKMRGSTQLRPVTLGRQHCSLASLVITDQPSNETPSLLSYSPKALYGRVDSCEQSGVSLEVTLTSY